MHHPEFDQTIIDGLARRSTAARQIDLLQAVEHWGQEAWQIATGDFADSALGVAAYERRLSDCGHRPPSPAAGGHLNSVSITPLD